MPHLSYTTPDVVAALQDFVPLILAFCSLVGIGIGVYVWSQRKLRQLIIETTQPIQPHANGGLSMTDLHTKVDRLGSGVDVVTEQQQAMTRTVEDRFARIRAGLLAASADRDAIAEAIAAHLGVELPPSRLVTWIKEEGK